ncbi:MAG: crossover junction endodeoxyribonuclease RuvC [Gemmatimonadetes bacterium]|nr:crossover junction endodeoxyribonuclease RuvC [Gemmatimonadota bacterium]
MIILGVDPGAAVTGYGVVARDRDGAFSLLECGVIRTDPAEPLGQRLRAIHEGVMEILERHSPDALAVESVFYGPNVRTTVVLGHARAAVMLAAALRDVPIAEYTPAEIKNAVTGSGRATKEQMQFMVQQLLRLRTVPEPADAADGVAVALCHGHTGSLHAVLRASSR